MDTKEKKRLNIFKSVHISKDSREKYFKVERGDLNTNFTKNINSDTNLSNKKDNNQESINHIFITHKKNINSISLSKKVLNQKNNGIFITTYNKNNSSIINNKFNLVDEKVLKTKLNLVYLESIKNLCNHLNKNFYQLTHGEKIININEYLAQMYQNLEILNKKIALINKQTIQINKEDYEIINILLNHLLYMNKILNNNISKNIVNIYSNLNNFCTSCNCSL